MRPYYCFVEVVKSRLEDTALYVRQLHALDFEILTNIHATYLLKGGLLARMRSGSPKYFLNMVQCRGLGYLQR